MEGPAAVVDLLDPELAQHSRVVRTTQFLNEEEVQLLLAAAARHKAHHAADPDWYGTTQRGKLYLQHRGLPQDLQPIVTRIKQLVEYIDQKSWKLLSTRADEGELEPRCVEFHQYSEHTKTECPNHVDTGSLFTCDLMLSRPVEDFEGGEMLTTTSDYSTGTQRLLNVTDHTFEYGDCLVFLSHKAHSVAPVTRGERKVLVIEFWQRGKCIGNHRCMGQCTEIPKQPKRAQDPETKGTDAVIDSTNKKQKTS